MRTNKALAAVEESEQREPFRPIPFEGLKEHPRLAHGFEKTLARDVVLDSERFGRHRVHLRELGEGPPLLLVHGLMTSSYSFRYVFEPLAKHYRVIAPDLVGTGRSDKPDRPYTPEALAHWLYELVQALDIQGAAAIGNSLGGYLCLELLLREPKAFSRLVCVHPPGWPEPRLWALEGLLSVPGMRSLLAYIVRRDPRRWAHKNVHYRDESLKSLEEAREYGAPLATEEGARAFVRYLGEAVSARAMRRFVRELEDRKARGENVPIPLLLLYADEDPMVPPSVGPKLHARLPGSQLEWLSESSHFAHVDTPEAFLERVEWFLRGRGDGE